jgi:prolyl 4-hydroxylase
MGEPSIGDIEIRASAGDPTAQLRMGRALLDQGQTERGRDWLRRAAGAGSTEAKLALGERLLSQEPYDILDGYKWTRAAAEDGNGEAEHLLAVVTAEGLGARQDWQLALDHLERSATLGYAPARAELAALAGDWSPSDAADWAASTRNWTVLRHAIDPSVWQRSPPVQPVSSSPRIAVVEKFISPEICRWLIARARPKLVRAQTIDPKTGRARYEASARTNSCIAFDVGHMDMVMVMLRARIARLTQLPVLGFEDSQVLHYAPGEEFKPHFDFLDTAQPGHAAAVASGGQRIVTCLIYLNEGYEGGETAFPSLGWRYKGRTGDALFFYNATPDGAPDRRMLHAGTATTNGEKYLFSQWIRFRVG